MNYLVGQGFSQRLACRVAGLSRSAYCRARAAGGAKTLRDHEPVRQWMNDFAATHRRWGYKRAWARTKSEGLVVGRDTFRRLWRTEGLRVRPRKAHKPRTAPRLQRLVEASAPGQVWAIDFQFDSDWKGRVFKVCNVIDEFTRQHLALRVERRMGAADVIEMLDLAGLAHGAPQALRADNGPEFIAGALGRWAGEHDTLQAFILPGQPWLGGFMESLHNRMRDELLEDGSVIGCKQFSCSGDAVWRLIMGCRRMLSVEDRAAIMAGVDAGLSQTRIAHLIGRSPSVVCREIARHTGPDGQYRAEDAGRAAQVARRRPKKRLLDRDEILRRRVIFDLSQGRTPRQISGRLSVEACGTVAPMDNSPHAQGRTISHEAIYTWIYAHPKKTLIEHGVCLPSRRWMRKKPPAGGRTPPIVGMRLIDERPDIADRMIPGNWEGDLIIGKDGASACATLVERTTRYLIIVALPLGRRADQVCDALTRRIQGLPEGAMRTLTWDQGREMARHQRLTQDTGVEVFFAHPHSPWERGTNENTNRLIRRYLPKGTPITSHQPYLDAIAYELNNCPRATLGYRTPTEAFNQLIATTH